MAAKSKGTQSFSLWLTLAITLLAFGLRTWHLGAQSVWYDEGLSWHYASQSLPGLLASVAGSEHPPLYFLFLHFWLRLTALAAGRPGSEFLLRFLSLLAGTLLVPLVYGVGCRLLGRRAATLAALLSALSPFQIWYAQEARGYTLMVLLAWGASYQLLTLLKRGEAAGAESVLSRTRTEVRGTGGVFRGGRWGLYALLLGLSLYTHLYAAFTLLAHAAFMAWWAWRRREWDLWWTWLAWAAVAGIAFLPYGLKVAGALGANDTYWRGVLGLRRAVAQVVHACAVGEAWHGPAATAATGLYLLLAGLGLVWLAMAPHRAGRSGEGINHSRGMAAVFLAVSIFVPLAVLLVIAYGRPKFAPRYLLTLAPGMALLAGQGCAALLYQRRRAAERALGWLSLAAMVGGSCLGLAGNVGNPEFAKPDWRSVGWYLAAHATPDDAVVIVAGHTWPAFAFYNQLGLAIYPIPPDLLPRVTHPVVTADVTATLNRMLAEGHRRAWLVLWQEPLADPRRITLEQFFDHGQRQEVFTEFEGLAVLQFEFPPGTHFGPPVPQHVLGIAFAGAIRLEGYDLWPERVRPGEDLTVRLYWRADAPIMRNYTAFNQLLSPEDKIVAQEDRLLGGDLYPTSRWPVGELVRETYRLTVAPNTPAGTYRLISGVYLRGTGQRLPILDTGQAGGHRAQPGADLVLLAEVMVESP